MDHESKQANEIADEYVTPNVLIEYKIKVIPVVDGTHLDAGRVVSADVAIVEPEEDEYGVLLTHI